MMEYMESVDSTDAMKSKYSMDSMDCMQSMDSMDAMKSRDSTEPMDFMFTPGAQGKPLNFFPQEPQHGPQSKVWLRPSGARP